MLGVAGPRLRAPAAQIASQSASDSASRSHVGASSTLSPRRVDRTAPAQRVSLLRAVARAAVVAALLIACKPAAPQKDAPPPAPPPRVPASASEPWILPVPGADAPVVGEATPFRDDERTWSPCRAEALAPTPSGGVLVGCGDGGLHAIADGSAVAELRATLPAAVTALATNGARILAVVATTPRAKVFTAPLGGGPVDVLPGDYEAPQAVAFAGAGALVLDGAKLAFSSALPAMPTLVAHRVEVHALSGDEIVWTEHGPDDVRTHVRRRRLPSGAVTSVAATMSQLVALVARDDDVLAVAKGGSIFRLTRDAPPRFVAGVPGGIDLVVSAGRRLVVVQRRIEADHRVLVVDVDAPKVTRLAAVAGHAAIAASATTLYLANGPALFRRPLDPPPRN